MLIAADRVAPGLVHAASQGRSSASGRTQTGSSDYEDSEGFFPTLVCPARVTTCPPFKYNMTPLNRLPDFRDTMTTVKLRASTILTAFGDVQSDLVGKAVVLTDGKAGTVENVWLDERHGLRLSIKGHDGKWPISTIKFEQGRQKP
jgi:hypothetical protein